jgi:hypothetical protein
MPQLFFLENGKSILASKTLFFKIGFIVYSNLDFEQHLCEVNMLFL